MSGRLYAACGALVVILATLPGWAGAQDLPRYKFVPGQTLEYESTGNVDYSSFILHEHYNWTAWVIRKNDDGSWHLFVRNTREITNIVKGKEQEPPELTTKVGSFDIYADGRAVPISEWESIGAAAVLPRLPRDAADYGSGWKQELPSGEYLYTAMNDQRNAGDFTFRHAMHTPESDVYRISAICTFHFDSQRGIVSSADTDFTEDKAHGSGHIATKTTPPESPEWTRQFEKESEIYSVAIRTVDTEVEVAEHDATKMETSLAEASRVLREAREKTKLPIFTKLLDERITQNKQLPAYFAQQKKDTDPVLNKPAPDWTLNDISGHPHSLKDYRGKVVVLDFWYRKCGWCIHAMPQVKQVAADFKDEPVVLLGMNTDTEVTDAEYVARKMSLNYETLTGAKGLADKYAVIGEPTLIVIDQTGIVRDIHLGYTAALRAQLGDSIRKLLREEHKVAGN